HLVVTSPPYWQIKDYGTKNQIGFHDDYRAYINNLNLVWEECARVLHPGCRLCVNIGDQFARAAHYGRYKVIPIREEIVGFCEKQLGLDYMGAIIWQKVTTCNTTGGATIMGSFPYPRNGIVKIDYEFILIFKKPGKAPDPPSPEAKEAARLSVEEWNEYFYGHWNFPGVRQSASGGDHPAAFPIELPFRLIRMFTFAGETVLDPFLGSGTTSLATHRLGRNSIGYEINGDFRPVIERRLRETSDLLSGQEEAKVEFLVRSEGPQDFSERMARWIEQGPRWASDQITRRVGSQEKHFGTRTTVEKKAGKRTLRLAEVLSPNQVKLTDGRTITLLGVEPWPSGKGGEDATERACEHLDQIARGNALVLSDDGGPLENGATARLSSPKSGPAYVYLANKKFVNARMIRDGYARADRSRNYRHRTRFEQYETEARTAPRGLWA
ncbi:thermonuclease family protein, partial [Candidatus Sumerlaeota bacterium]|nr:thermonuclease family protein [Candidatus Sumerlaeota bacterium]